MKTQRKIWIAALVTAGFAYASAPSLAAAPSLFHPSDARVQTVPHTPADLDLTRKVRDALVASDALSTLGKNVVIDARDGKVTLRGLVTNLSERTLVGDLASRIAGQGHVENELEFLYTS